MQKWIGIGNVTTDVLLQQTDAGKYYCKFVLAVNRPYSKGGEKVTDFFPCIAWDNQANAIAKYCCKGSKMTVIGTIQIQQYKDKEGINRTTVNVIVQEQEFLSSKTDGEKPQMREVRTEQLPVPNAVYDESPPF